MARSPTDGICSPIETRRPERGEGHAPIVEAAARSGRAQPQPGAAAMDQSLALQPVEHAGQARGRRPAPAPWPSGWRGRCATDSSRSSRPRTERSELVKLAWRGTGTRAAVSRDGQPLRTGHVGQAGRARHADHGAELHAGVHPGRRFGGGHLRVGAGQRVGRGLQLRRRRSGREAEAADQPAAHVGVHRAHRPPERQRRDGPGGVAADAGQRLQPIGRRRPALRSQLRPRPMQRQGAAVVAEPRPGRQHLGRWRRGHGLGCREAVQEAGEAIRHARRLRLLEHHLADQDRPRIGRPAPWHVPGRAGVPPQDAAADAARGAPVDRSERRPACHAAERTATGMLCRRVPG